MKVLSLIAVPKLGSGLKFVSTDNDNNTVDASGIKQLLKSSLDIFSQGTKKYKMCMHEIYILNIVAAFRGMHVSTAKHSNA